MKKFFTIIPLQNKFGLESCHYVPVGNSLLDLEGETSFPILTAVNGFAQSGEEIRIIAVATVDADKDATKANRELFKKDAEELCRRKGVLLPPDGVEFVLIPNDPSVNGQVDVFSRLIRLVEDDDELFACMTYGTKPLSMALTMAIHYAYRIKKNASISCLLYGEINRSVTPHTARVYDMTALPQLDELVHTLAESKVDQPELLLDSLFHLSRDDD